MRLLTSSFSFVVVALSLLDAVSANQHGKETFQRKRHVARSPRPVADNAQNITLREENVTLHKRFDSAKFSFYDAGLGACGKTNSASDYIVALNTAQWDGGSHCFDMITITYNGKSTQAQITDQCPGCPYGGLDFSRGLFNYFASEDAGIIYGTWNYGSGAVQSTSATQPPKTSQAPTSTYTPPVTTSSTVSKTTSTSETPTSTSSSSSSSSSVASSVASTSSSASNTQSASSTQNTVAVEASASPVTEVLGQFNEAMVLLAQLIEAAAKVSGK